MLRASPSRRPWSTTRHRQAPSRVLRHAEPSTLRRPGRLAARNLAREPVARNGGAVGERHASARGPRDRCQRRLAIDRRGHENRVVTDGHGVGTLSPRHLGRDRARSRCRPSADRCRPAASEIGESNPGVARADVGSAAVASGARGLGGGASLTGVADGVGMSWRPSKPTCETYGPVPPARCWSLPGLKELVGFELFGAVFSARVSLGPRAWRPRRRG